MTTTNTQETAVRSRLGEVAFTVVIVTPFLALVLLGIWLFRERHWVLSPVTFTAALMCIPLVDHTAAWKERLLASLVMPFAMLGLASFVALYATMFHFAWFEGVFNNEGGGPLGMIAFAIAGLVVGGWGGVEFIKRVTGRDLRWGAPAVSGQSGDTDLSPDGQRGR